MYQPFLFDLFWDIQIGYCQWSRFDMCYNFICIFLLFAIFRQVALADVILLNKTDLISPDLKNQIESYIRYTTIPLAYSGRTSVPVTLDQHYRFCCHLHLIDVNVNVLEVSAAFYTPLKLVMLIIAAVSLGDITLYILWILYVYMQCSIGYICMHMHHHAM